MGHCAILSSESATVPASSRRKLSIRKAGGFSPGASEPADPRMLSSIDTFTEGKLCSGRPDSRTFFEYYNEIVPAPEDVITRRPEFCGGESGALRLEQCTQMAGDLFFGQGPYKPVRNLAVF